MMFQQALSAKFTRGSNPNPNPNPNHKPNHNPNSN